MDKKIETLEKQLQLLFERSHETKDNLELCRLTEEMVRLVNALWLCGGEGREQFNALENEDLPNGAYLVRVTYTGNETRRETVRLPIHCQKTRRKVDADRS